MLLELTNKILNNEAIELHTFSRESTGNIELDNTYVYGTATIDREEFDYDEEYSQALKDYTALTVYRDDILMVQPINFFGSVLVVLKYEE